MVDVSENENSSGSFLIEQQIRYFQGCFAKMQSAIDPHLYRA
jgi:hypothetical protein